MLDSIAISSYLAVAFIGLIHGFEPGHGWPVAALLSLRRTRPFSFGLVASTILSSAHFISSLAVLGAYYVLNAFVDFNSAYLRYLVAFALLILAFRMFTKKEKSRQAQFDTTHDRKRELRDLRSLAAFALMLGFAHEEEFMLLTLAVGGVSPLILIVSYAAAVTFSLIGITLVAIRAYAIVEDKLRKYERHLPRVTGLVLAVLALLFLSGAY